MNAKHWTGEPEAKHDPGRVELPGEVCEVCGRLKGDPDFDPQECDCQPADDVESCEDCGAELDAAGWCPFCGSGGPDTKGERGRHPAAPVRCHDCGTTEDVSVYERERMDPDTGYVDTIALCQDCSEARGIPTAWMVTACGRWRLEGQED